MRSMNSRDHTGGSPDIRVIQRVAPYLWPKGDTGARIRVVIAMVALVAAKLATVGTPIFYMWAVDGLTEPDDQTVWFMLPVMLVIAALVGTQGLEQTVYIGLSDGDFGVGMTAGIGMAIIAIIADRITQSVSLKRQQQLGLKMNIL